MKKTLVMLWMAALILCAVQDDVNAQGQRDRFALSPVNIEENGIPPLTDHEKDKIKKKVLQKLEIPRQGDSIGNPILPNRWERVAAGGTRYWIFVTIVSNTITIWVDPVIAVGYDYSVEKGPRITAVELPKGIGDNMFDLWIDQSGTYVDSGIDIKGGTLHKFEEPVSNFSIRGIETSAKLNPDNETAFPTGLRFEKTGKAVVTMTSVIREI